MKYKTAILWSLVNYKWHKQLAKSDMTIEALMPLVERLFPGIAYYPIGFSYVLYECVIPVLEKWLPELLTTPEKKVSPKAMTEVATMLPSKGYEWQDAKWQSKFKKLLAAA